MVLIVILIIFHAGKDYAETDLEIYTSDNIYYIDGLKVTNEVNEDILIFANRASLKQYISTVTVESLK